MTQPGSGAESHPNRVEDDRQWCRLGMVSFEPWFRKRHQITMKLRSIFDPSNSCPERGRILSELQAIGCKRVAALMKNVFLIGLILAMFAEFGCRKASAPS